MKILRGLRFFHTGGEMVMLVGKKKKGVLKSRHHRMEIFEVEEQELFVLL